MPVLRIILFILMAGITGSSCIAQKYDIKYFGPNVGFHETEVWETTKDQKGNLWIGAVNTLVRYDGRKFHTYSSYDGLGGTYFTNLFFDDHQNLFFLSIPNGIAWLDGQRFHPLDVPYLNNKTLMYNTLTREGEILLGTTDTGLCIINQVTHSIRCYNKDREGNPVNFIYQGFETPSGEVYAVGESGLYHLDRLAGTLNRIQGVKNFLMCAATAGRKTWLGGVRALLCMEGDTVTDYSHLLRTGTLIYYARAEEDQVLMGTNYGILIVRDNKAEWIDKENGFETCDVYHITEDVKNAYWLSTSKGLYYLNLNTNRYFEGNSQVSLENNVRGISSDPEGRICITSFGDQILYLDENSQFRVIRNHDVQSIHSSNCIVRHPRLPVMVTSASVLTQPFIWFNGSKTLYQYKIENDRVVNIQNIEFADSLQVLAATSEGLYSIDPVEQQHRVIPGFDGFIAKVIPAGEQGFYALAGSGEVLRYDKGSDSLIMVPGINKNQYELTDGWYDAGSGTLYLCTAQGLVIHRNGCEYNIRRYKEEPFLPGSIWVDGLGQVWIGHKSGLLVLDPLTHEMYNYGYNNGLKQGTTNAGSIYGDSAYVYVGASNKLYQFDIRRVFQTRRAYRFKIPRVYYQDKEYYTESLWSGDSVSLYLQHDENNLQFELLGMDFEDNADCKYSWRMLGTENSFSAYTPNFIASYSNLDPGSYVFEARFKDSYGNESEVKRVYVYIEKPFWQKAWFYVIEISILVFILLASFYFSKKPENKTGQVLTFLIIIICFESLVFSISTYTDHYTMGVPVFQLLMNIVLAATLQPLEKWMKYWVNRMMKG